MAPFTNKGTSLFQHAQQISEFDVDKKAAKNHNRSTPYCYRVLRTLEVNYPEGPAYHQN